MGNARPIDGRPQNEVQVGPDKLEVVACFCYLGDMLSAGGGCKIAVTTRVKTAWKKFRELLPVLTSRHLSNMTRGHVYSSCVLHASETWPLTKTNLQPLQRNDRAMIRQICSIKPEAGRPKLTWKKLTERDCREWKLTKVDPHERSTWRSGVRSAMRAASQLRGKGPTKVDDAPAPAR